MLLGALGAMACVPSLHQLYTSRDVILDDALVGAWVDSSSRERWDFRSGEDSAYRLVYTDDKGRDGRFIVHLVRLGADRFLDLYPDSMAQEGNQFWSLHFVPAHTFALVESITPQLRIRPMDEDGVKRYARAHPALLPSTTVGDDEFVLTASTAQLQAYLRRHAHDSKVFGTGNPLTRAE
jgi:hypothetical protein